MVQFIGNRVPIQDVGVPSTPLDVGGVFGALAKPYLDQLTPALKQSTIDLHNANTQKLIDAKRRIDAAAAGVGDLSNPNFNALTPATIAGDSDPGKFANLLLAYKANTLGAASPQTQNAQVGAGQSYGNTAASDAARNATQRYGYDTAERTKRDLAANTPQTVLVPGEDGAPPVPTIVRQADSYNRPASVNIGEQQGALAPQIYKRILGGDENIPDAALKATNAQPTRDNIYNYAVKNPDGSVSQGRSLDGGKTDAVTNKPLPANAQLLSPSNAGGASALLGPGGLDQSQKNKLIPARDSYRQVGELATRIKEMVQQDPSIVGPTGNITRGMQQIMDTGNGVARLFGSQQKFQDEFVRASKDLQARGINAPGLVFDPKAAAVAKLNTILMYKAASALAGQSNHDLSNQDVEHIRTVVGDPTSWLEGPNAYLTGLDTIVGEAKRNMDTIDAQLSSGNIVPPNTAAPASPTQQPVTKWGKDANGNIVKVQ